eukprot:136463-Amphidinium_carterae.1
MEEGRLDSTVRAFPLAPTLCLAINAVSSNILPTRPSMEKHIMVVMQGLAQIISNNVTFCSYSRLGAKPTHMSLAKLTGGKDGDEVGLGLTSR